MANMPGSKRSFKIYAFRAFLLSGDAADAKVQIKKICRVNFCIFFKYGKGTTLTYMVTVVSIGLFKWVRTRN